LLVVFGGGSAVIRLLFEGWLAALPRLVGYCSAAPRFLVCCCSAASWLPYGNCFAAVRRLVGYSSAFGLLLFGG
jgi:hypothetical protein